MLHYSALSVRYPILANRGWRPELTSYDNCDLFYFILFLQLAYI